MSHSPNHLPSPNHPNSREARFFGGLLGRAILVTPGQESSETRGVVYEAFPDKVTHLHIVSVAVRSARQLRSRATPLVKTQAEDLAGLLRIGNRYDSVDASHQLATGSLSLPDLFHGEVDRVWDMGQSDRDHGFIGVIDRTQLPLPHTASDTPSAMVLYLSGVSFGHDEAAEPSFSLEWSRSHPLSL